MKSVFSYLLLIAIVVIFFVQVGTVFMDKLHGTLADDLFKAQMIFAFVSLFCIILVFRRSIIGGILYAVSTIGFYGWMMTGNLGGALDIGVIISMGTNAFYIILSLLVLIELLYAKARQKEAGSDKKTDWYYNEESYDRKFDERADKNQYKF